MAEFPAKVHLTSHPIYLDIRGPSLYEDDKHCTWMHLVMESGGDLLVQLCQLDDPREHKGLTTSLQTLSTMPSWCVLHLGTQYMDSMHRFWRIVHHVKENAVEKMILELMEDS